MFLNGGEIVVFGTGEEVVVGIGAIIMMIVVGRGGGARVVEKGEKGGLLVVAGLGAL